MSATIAEREQTSATPQRVTVAASGTAYDVVIGAKLIAQAGALLQGALKGRRCCIVTDDAVAALYLKPFQTSLEDAGFTVADVIVLKAGEGSKTFAELEHIIERCLTAKLDRKSCVIALGGGVVGDIAGFAAAILLRGVAFAQVPTTLLAQVDSAVGGKTAVNTAAGKNLAGAFYQPKIVLADTDALNTLPAREIKAGYAEILKYALIGDAAFFDWLEQHARGVLAGEREAIAHAVAVSCRAKAAVVAADEREETGVRALLNLGHTFGHALEALGGYDGRLLHGEAVAIGLNMAFDFSAAVGLCAQEDAARVARHLHAAGLMTQPPFAVHAQEMLGKMQGDKKNVDGRLTLVLARGIGRAFIEKNANAQEVGAFLQEYLSQKGHK